MSKEMKKEPILKVEHLKMYFPLTKGFMKKTGGVVKAVDDISFSVEKGKPWELWESRDVERRLPANAFYRLTSPQREKFFMRDRI